MKRLLVFVVSMFLASTAFAAVRFDDGSKTITTAGTPLALTATSTDATMLIVCGDTNNTGKICVGASPLCTAGAQQGAVRGPGQCTYIVTPKGDTFDISTIKVDASVSGEEATFFWVNDRA